MTPGPPGPAGEWPPRGTSSEVTTSTFKKTLPPSVVAKKAEAARGSVKEEAASRRPRHPAVKAPAPSLRQWSHTGARGGLRGVGVTTAQAGDRRGPQHREGRRELWGAPTDPMCPSTVWEVPKGKVAGDVAWHFSAERGLGARSHILGTELPRPVSGSGPFTAHRLPRLLPKANEESGSLFPTQWPQSC